MADAPANLGVHYLETALGQLRSYRSLGERAIAQAPDDALQAALDPESNSIAVTVKHLAGNMRSRWTDFLTTDGEKPDRNRDAEFVEGAESRAELMELWERGWGHAIAAIEQLGPDDLLRTVAIRGVPHTVLQAIDRQLTHYAYHVGQIVYLARHFAGDRWRSLSIPRVQSADFNRRMMGKRQGG